MEPTLAYFYSAAVDFRVGFSLLPEKELGRY